MTQDQALKILKTGNNVFLTGEAGSGKTHTVNQYVSYLRKHGVGVAVTASTGIAATHLGGVTIHSWSGIGIRKEFSDKELANLASKKRLKSRAQKTSVLIIDEISMIDAKTLTVIDLALKSLCDNQQPFGGVQVIFVGDFFQLPPVSDGSSEFAYNSPAWSEAKPVVCYLSEQHRQSDSAYNTFLNSIRAGKVTQTEISLLESRTVKIQIEHQMTRLYSHNIDVDGLNHQKLGAIETNEQFYQMTSRGRKPLVEQLKKGCLSPEKLILKIGAQVMFTKNNYEVGYVNGTLGEIIDFSQEDLPVVRTKSGQEIEVEPVDWQIEEHGRVLASVTQIPLRLAWAITVHKSQGMSLDEAVVDLSRAFEFGQGYVALSRVRSTKGLHVVGFNNKSLLVHPDIATADLRFRQHSDRAVKALDSYSPEQLKAKHQAFIKRTGGKIKSKKNDSGKSTYEQTLELFLSGKDIGQIAEARQFARSTIISHLEKLKQEGKLSSQQLERLIPKNLKPAIPQISQYFAETEEGRLTPVFHKLEGRYSYEDLKLVRLVLEE